MIFLTNLINGLSLGSVYAIIALGYTMVYGISKMLNFAHGDVIMVGAYISFCATMYLNLPAWVSVILAMIVCTALGILIEGLAYRPLRGTGSLAVLITAIGVSYFLQNAALLIWGSAPKVFTSIFSALGSSISLFGGELTVTWEALFTLVAAVIIMIGMTLFTGQTKVGKAMRAVSEDNGAAQLMGINVNSTISMTCSALHILLLCPLPAPCPVSKPSQRLYSAASVPFPEPCWAASSSVSSRYSEERIYHRNYLTPSYSAS